MGQEHLSYTHNYNINEPINHCNFCIRPRPSLTYSYTVLSSWNRFLCFGNCHSLHHMMSTTCVSCILQIQTVFSGSSVLIHKQTNWCPVSKIKPNSQDFFPSKLFFFFSVCHPLWWHILIAGYQNQLSLNYMSLF